MSDDRVAGEATQEESQRWHLFLHPEPLKIVRLEPNSAVPDWARRPGPMTAITWNAHETSVIAPAGAVPVGVHQAGPFQAFEVEGPLDFTLIGVLTGLLRPLAERHMSVITKSTFDTDWILVPVEQVDEARRAWEAEGHLVRTRAASAATDGPPRQEKGRS